MQNQISSWGHIRQTKTKGILQSDEPVLFQKIDVIKDKKEWAPLETKGA